MSKKASQIIIFAVTFIFLSVLSGLYFSFQRDHSKVFFSQFYSDGFNFRKYRDDEKDFKTFQAGEVLDISNLKNTSGQALLETSNEELLLLYITDPSCPFRILSNDLVSNTRITTTEIKVGYYPVVFNSSSRSDLRNFANAIGFIDIFTPPVDSPPSAHFSQMPTPAHILVNRQGLILQVWFSSTTNADARRRMSAQLSYELFLINDVLKATRRQLNPSKSKL